MDRQRSVRLNKKKKSTNTSPYPDEVMIGRLARAFYPAILACWNSEEGQRSLVGARPLHLANARPLCRLKAPLGLSLLRNRGILISEENKKSELFSYREKVRIFYFSGSPPGRHSYGSRNRTLTKAPLGLLLPCLRQGRAVQVLLSA